MAVGYAHVPRATAKADRRAPSSREPCRDFALTAIQKPSLSPAPSIRDEKAGGKSCFTRDQSNNNALACGMDVYSILNVKINE